VVHVHVLKGSIPLAVARCSLGPGETETMALALESGISRVILDDLEAREFGRSLGP
jgi:predicted nucleic acid-binding protein